MTFELEMALDALNGKIDKGIEFPEAVDLVLEIYPVSQKELTIAYDNQPALPTPTPQITDYACIFKREKDSTLYQLNCNNVMFELVNIPNGTFNHHIFTCGRWIPLGNKTMQAAIQWASKQSLPPLNLVVKFDKCGYAKCPCKYLLKLLTAQQ